MKRILIADDRPNSRELISTALESFGYEVLEAVDGVDALKVARTERPDAIILDIQMPGLDGFGVIRELRADSSLKLTPVMALTAGAMETDRNRAIEAGFDSYISKPVSLPALRAEVLRLLGMNRAAQPLAD